MLVVNKSIIVTFLEKTISRPTKLLLMTVMIDMTPAKHVSKILKISKHFCKTIQTGIHITFFLIHTFKLSQQNTGMVFRLCKI